MFLRAFATLTILAVMTTAALAKADALPPVKCVMKLPEENMCGVIRSRPDGRTQDGQPQYRMRAWKAPCKNTEKRLQDASTYKVDGSTVTITYTQIFWNKKTKKKESRPGEKFKITVFRHKARKANPAITDVTARYEYNDLQINARQTGTKELACQTLKH